ncbi:GerMN domain-containing protein [Citricoccus sp. GCM10030269]|uniref:GerMN domain-containing protein n=1 Tax=Citricoccus sp. GCM10030269 TaxID=3273388 RepID=UPI0036105BFB
MRQTSLARRPLLATAALAATLTLGLSACGTGGDDPSESPTASDTASATESPTSSPSATETTEPTTSAPASPSESPSSSAPASTSPAAPSSTPASESPQAAEATVYWVSLAGEGPTGIEFPGCGDSLIESTAEVSGAGEVGEPSRVEAAIQALLNQKKYDVGQSGLINALYQSELTLEDASISGDTVTVELSGMPISAGTCDDPRIIAQLENTAIANAGVYTATILVDGTPIRDVMSQKN